MSEAKNTNSSQEKRKHSINNTFISAKKVFTLSKKITEYGVSTQRNIKVPCLKDENDDEKDVIILYSKPKPKIKQFSKSNQFDSTKSFINLPVEIWERIACILPIRDLLSLSETCSLFHSVFINKNYMNYKIKFYKMLLSPEKLPFFENAKIHNWYKVCANILSSFCFSPLDFINIIKNHFLYDIAKKLSKENTDSLDIWIILFFLVILIENVQDIYIFFKKLANSSIHLSNLVDFFYGIAYCTLGIQNCHYSELDDYSMNTKLHQIYYKIYYVLYIFENEFKANISDFESIYADHGQQTIIRYGNSLDNLKLTYEQILICKFNPDKNETIKIVAFAGSGKTTTLLRYVSLRPNKTFLLIVYNKSISNHAANIFPKNTTVRTGHSLAYRYQGFKFRNKMTNGLKVQDIVKKIENRKGTNTYIQAGRVKETLNCFFASDDDDIDIIHIPLNLQIDPIEKRNIVSDAKRYWDVMRNINDSTAKMTHDGYMKVWQLSQPNLGKYDAILVDEAQDCTPCLLKVITNQENVSKILVGDPHQQIYSFRGAVNALQNVESSQTFYLTQSFRFGPEIAFVSFACLYVLKDVKEKLLVGGLQPCTIRNTTINNVPDFDDDDINHCYLANNIDNKIKDCSQKVILCRYNASVFREAAELVLPENRPKVGILGGLKNFGLDQIEDIYILSLSEENRNRAIENNFIKCFTSFYDLHRYAIQVSDNELLGKISIIQEHGSNLPKHLSNLKQFANFSNINADIIVGTVHKAKGLEFDFVEIHEDLALKKKENVETQFSFLENYLYTTDDINLIYVAVTRAKHKLLISEFIKSEILSRVGYFGIWPIPIKTLFENENLNNENCLKIIKQVYNEGGQLIHVKRPLTKKEIGRVVCQEECFFITFCKYCLINLSDF